MDKVQKNKMIRIMAECLVVFILGIILFTKILIHGVVPSGSMEPTLNVGDRCFINGLAYAKREPERGDIVIFKSDEMGGELLIKRIIGLPCDSISFQDGYIYLNGELVYEEYLPEDTETNSFRDFQVPEGCYFVMGDNREDSYDSRFWDNPYVEKEDIKGKMICSISLSKFANSAKSLIAEIKF